MTIRTRILLVYLLLIGGGYIYLVSWVIGDIRPRYLESMEESLVDTANILASAVENNLHNDTLSTDSLRRIFDSAYQRQIDAKIYSIQKKSIDLRVYVTDDKGIVRYDSDDGKAEGLDYSQWNDVLKTLRGEYGARATQRTPDDNLSLSIYVAAPIRAKDRIIGVLSVGKPTDNINGLVKATRTHVLYAGLLGGLLVIATGIAFSVWIITPIERLTAYARAVRDGKPASLPRRLAGREVSDLRHAFDEMRVTLEDKEHVEHYTQALAHEIKAPLAAIRGASELLSEDQGKMPPEQRAKFLQNLQRESGRIQRIVDQLLQLARLEARPTKRDVHPVALQELLLHSIATAEPAAHARQITLKLENSLSVTVPGETSLLAQSVDNLLQNAIEFTPVGGIIEVTLSLTKTHACIQIEDNGPGIPEYARERIFERFYSLPRPDTGQKSTGLGLSLVSGVAQRHGGTLELRNRPEGGCRALLRLALAA